MSVMGIIAAIFVFGVGLAWVFSPLFFTRGELGLIAQRKREQDELLTLYERVVMVIRDLDDDFQTGKLPREEYELERDRWTQRGVEILQALETHHDSPLKKSPAKAERDFDDAIEAAIKQYVTSMKG
ncbi:MAG: hypothetical protein D6711_11975 [Chloroflexi bacterium]|nr:MAG: hypothetical protein D6711_11975 [Chloroflexota bacterium]